MDSHLWGEVEGCVGPQEAAAPLCESGKETNAIARRYHEVQVLAAGLLAGVQMLSLFPVHSDNKHGAAPGPDFEESNSLGTMGNSEATGKSANLEQKVGNCGMGVKRAVCGSCCSVPCCWKPLLH